jgi:RNA-directed DNA polymerase
MARLHKGRYQPNPARRVYIPKGDGSQRSLSIQCVEDKLVQQAVVTVLNEIYETDFKGFSYGFRPERSQHEALDALTYGISKRKVNWVLDLDIRQFFDTVEHDWLIRMVQHRVQDKRLIKLIIRWIKVGVVDEEGKRQAARCGLPQGAVISPLLSNIYLHYVFDLWSHKWRKTEAKSEVLIVRYADDAVLCFHNKRDANAYLTMLHPRLAKFGLKVHPEKTRLIRFGRYAAEQSARYGEGKLKTFDFLGFTHYCTVRQNGGGFKVGRKTIRKRLISQIKAIQRELRRRMHESIGLTLKWLRSVITGHMNYYCVPGNSQCVSLFHDEIVKRWFKMLRRRSQRHRITWARFGVWIRRHLPKVRIVHPYPEMRFCAKYSK